MSKALRTFSGAILLWVVGCFIVTMALAELYMLATGSKPGTPIFLDELVLNFPRFRGHPILCVRGVCHGQVKDAESIEAVPA